MDNACQINIVSGFNHSLFSGLDVSEVEQLIWIRSRTPLVSNKGRGTEGPSPVFLIPPDIVVYLYHREYVGWVQHRGQYEA